MAVSTTPEESSSNNIMTSLDGTTWVNRSTSSIALYGVVFGNIFVAVGVSSTDRGVLTSTDGVAWTDQSTPVGGGTWTSVTYGNGTYVAVSGTGKKAYSSPSRRVANWQFVNVAGLRRRVTSCTDDPSPFFPPSISHRSFDSCVFVVSNHSATVQTDAHEHSHFVLVSGMSVGFP